MKKVPTIKYSRVVGYMRPVMLWNKGKKKEWSTRKFITSSQIGKN